MKAFKGFNSIHFTVHSLWFLYKTNINCLVEFFFLNHHKRCLIQNLKNSKLKAVDVEECSGSKVHGDIVLWSFSETLKTFIPSCRHWLDTETVKCRPQYNLLPFYLFLIYLICFCEQQPGGRRQLVPLIQYQIMLRCRHQFSLIHVHPERKSINMLIISRLKWNVNCDFNWTKPVALMTLRHVLVLFHLYYICV